MRTVIPGFIYLFLDEEHYENIQNYKPSEEFLQIVKKYLPDDWSIYRNGIWFVCDPAQELLPIQGWKIHISATDQTAVETLYCVVPILIDEMLTFKFVTDFRMMHLMTSKNWQRTGSGKFITIYPRDEDHFKHVIERCYKTTTNLSGPYILSDRPYKDSKVVFYRYGELKGTTFLNVYGEQVRSIVAPDGQLVPDDRKPYFHLPSWMEDPFGKGQGFKRQGDILLHNRYLVQGVFRYSSKGGIYRAIDTRYNTEVVIKEARPLVGSKKYGWDSFYLLDKEARILQRLEHTGLVPKFIDLFQEWEHQFLVEERLVGETLFAHALGLTLGLIALENIDRVSYFEKLHSLIRELATSLQEIHQHGIILRDFTKTNVFVMPDGKIKFIDFEMAYGMGEDVATYGWTLGYASPQQLENKDPVPEDDYYALGALILDSILFNAQYLALNPTSISAPLGEFLSEFKLPAMIKDIILGLLEPDPQLRWRPEQVLKALDGVRLEPNSQSDGRLLQGMATDPCLRAEIETTVQGITSYILKKADFNRVDRLWPTNPRVFSTNSVNIQYGAAGTAYYLWRVLGYVPENIIAWILDALEKQKCPPGLYNGLAGVAWFLLDIGMEDKAEEVLAASYNSELIFSIPDLYFGAAGWGLTNLHFWHKTKEPAYLERALEVGEYLLQTAKTNEKGTYWESDNSVINYGFGHGSSGIATYLIYLHAVQRDDAFLEIAESALDFEINNRIMLGDKVCWVMHEGDRTGPRVPHMRFGTAGVGTAVLRFYLVTRKAKFGEFAELCAYSVKNKYSNKLWQDFGLAGYGEFLIDMYHYFDQQKYLEGAYYVATGILPYRIERPEGIALPGIELLRISCDYGTGMAGTGAFLHRLLNPWLPRLFMLDDILAQKDSKSQLGIVNNNLKDEKSIYSLQVLQNEDSWVASR